ncbi:hypothetical protein TELCIR_21049, partial [Teladorsagia circumcincta]
DSVERQIPVILVGNKCDLRAELGEVVSNHDGAALAAKMGVLFMETSAVDGSNVDSSMLALTRGNPGNENGNNLEHIITGYSNMPTLNKMIHKAVANRKEIFITEDP